MGARGARAPYLHVVHGPLEAPLKISTLGEEEEEENEEEEEEKGRR